MLNRMEISTRFFLCYEDKSRRGVAEIFGVRKGTVTEWANEGTVPWSKLKFLSDSQAVSWNWLIEGWKPRNSEKRIAVPAVPSPVFDKAGINGRFLTLFPNRSQTEIGIALGVSPGMVHEWVIHRKQVGWRRLDNAVHMFGVSWDWLLDGIGPQYREKRPAHFSG